LKLPRNLLSAVFLSRLLILVTVLIGSSIILNHNIPSVSGSNPKIGVPVLNGLVRWDSIYYFNITLNGLSWYRSATIQSTNIECWAFRPFFPMIVASLRWPIASIGDYESCLIAAFCWNIIAFLLAAVFFYKLTEILYDAKVASLATLFLCISPAAVFFVAPYPESTYLLLITASFFFVEKEKTKLSTSLSFLAGFTRPEGILTSILMGLKGLAKRGKKGIMLLVCAVFLVLPLPIYMLFSYVMTSNFYMPIYKEQIWPKTPFVYLFFDIIHGGHTYLPNFGLIPFLTLTLPFVTLAIVTLCLAGYFIHFSRKNLPKVDLHLKEKQTPYFIYMLLVVAFFLYASDFNSFTRYVSLLLPMYWMTSLWAGKSRVRTFFLASIYIILMIIGTLLYINWYSFI